MPGGIDRIEPRDLFLQLRDLVLEPRNLCLRHRVTMSVGSLQLRHVARDALVNPLKTPLQSDFDAGHDALLGHAPGPPRHPGRGSALTAENPGGVATGVSLFDRSQPKQESLSEVEILVFSARARRERVHAVQS